MNVHINHSLLGDAILVEPAMAAWSEANAGQPVNLRMDAMNAPFECLFRSNPAVNLIPSQEPFPDSRPIITPNCSAAFWDANRRKMPFAAGYFPLFGMRPNPSVHRLHFKLFGLAKREKNSYICICPNSRSCLNSIDPSNPCNIKASREWWRPIVQFALHEYGIMIYDLGSNEDEAMDFTWPFHGHDFRKVADFLNSAALVISVETGLLHLAGGIEGLPIIFLSAATPAFFSAPKWARVVRAVSQGQTDFPQEEVIEHIKEIL